MYKYDTHIHLQESSTCSSITPEMYDDMLTFYHDVLGYSGIFITDHFFNSNSTANEVFGLSWEQKIDYLFKGYNNIANKSFNKYGDRFTVLPGFEYTYLKNDYLIYNINKEKLIDIGELTMMNANLSELFTRLMKDYEAVIVHAHPFCLKNYIDSYILIPELTNAVEVYNTSNDIEGNQNKLATAYAEHFYLPKTAGTDLHYLGYNPKTIFHTDVITGIESEFVIKNPMQYLSALYQSKVKPLIHDKEGKIQ